MLRRTFLFIITLVCALKSEAQDPSFSQSYNNPIYMNPALTGANKGMRIFLNDMRQWTRVPGNFNTATVSADVAEECSSVGLGVTALHDERGEGFLTTNSFGMTASWSRPIVSRKLDFAFGLGGNFVQKSLDWSKLEFSDQFDPVLGKITNVNAQPQNTGRGFADINAGVSFKYLVDLKSGFTMLNNFGFAVHHINRPNEGLIDASRLPALFTLHAGSLIPIGKHWTQKGEFVFPYFVYNWQELFNPSYKIQREIVAGCYIFKNSILYGFHYRDGYLPFSAGNTNQLGLSVGYQIPFRNTSHAFQLTYSYMFPMDGVSYSVTGTHEICLLIMFDQVHILCSGSGGPPGANKCFNDKRHGYIPQL
jgi:type IX secretion system PorP/SprF family membrane protein